MEMELILSNAWFREINLDKQSQPFSNIAHCNGPRVNPKKDQRKPKVETESKPWSRMAVYDTVESLELGFCDIHG